MRRPHTFSKRERRRGKAPPAGGKREILCGGRFQVPWRIYHGVPCGWTKDELSAVMRQLGGEVSLQPTPMEEVWLAEVSAEAAEWFGYRQALERVADGVKAGDVACIELAVRFIELRHIGSYAGYTREKLARRLKHVALTESQRQRLVRHFGFLVANWDYTLEFREYKKLWKRLVPEGTEGSPNRGD